MPNSSPNQPASQDAKTETQQNRVRIGGLWKHKTRDGKTTFLSGPCSPSSQFFVFPNGHKQKPHDPDYILYIAPAAPKPKTEGGEL